jgi:hypothetical protein
MPPSTENPSKTRSGAELWRQVRSARTLARGDPTRTQKIFKRGTRTEDGKLVEEGSSENELVNLLHEAAREAAQNAISVFSLAAFITLYALLFLGTNLFSTSIVLYLLITVVGLTIFAMGLRQGLMPLGEMVGNQLPLKVSRAVVFSAIFVLGILCTIAEPAIGALQEAGQNTNRPKAPLLAVILDNPFILMIAVGVGVGFAAVLGCVRLVYDLKVKSTLLTCCIPTVIVTYILQFLRMSELDPPRFPTVTGLAWDCGAVTTGPVTVPIVLALGIGVAAASKTQSAGSSASGDDPVRIPTSARRDEKREMMRRQSMLHQIDPVARSEQRPFAEDEAEDDAPDLSGFGIVTLASLFPVIAVWLLGFLHGGDSAIPDEVAPADANNPNAAEENGVVKALVGTCRAIVPLAGFLLLLQMGLIREPIKNPVLLGRGLGFCLVGMFLFSIGLDGALVPLGSGAGKALPNAVDKFGTIFGPIVILAFGFLSGAGATFAEPALRALGETVEKLTKGSYTANKLVFAVAIGVGCGISLGMAKVYFNLPLWPIILVGYGTCTALTIQCDDAITCIAWDSAGVTTGPVTVPIVLASGLSLGSAVDASEGFGILSCASIGPIIAVLVTGILAQRAAPAATARGHAESELPRLNSK